jgi:uncharacterized membrane protein YdjX (TVP38/TMEM64 family)
MAGNGVAEQPAEFYAVTMEREPRAAIPETAGSRVEKRALWVKAAVIVLVLLAVPLAWQWTPLNEWINFQRVLQMQQAAKDHPTPLYVVLGAYLLGSLVLFPITVLNLATVFAFGPVMGNLYALIGWLASATMGFGIGRALGRDIVQRLARSKLDRLLGPAERHGFLTVLAVRVLPVAPFTLVNFVIGASGIRFHDFFLASLAGRVPGIVTLSVAGVQIESLLRSPAIGTLALLAVTLIAVPLATRWLWNHFSGANARKREPDPASR